MTDVADKSLKKARYLCDGGFAPFFVSFKMYLDFIEELNQSSLRLIGLRDGPAMDEVKSRCP